MAVEDSAQYQHLVDHLLEHRDDTSAWAVLADVLLAGGHPRGELAALDQELTQTPRDTARHRVLVDLRSDLLRTHREVLHGPDGLLRDLDLTWRSGFILEARVPNHFIHPDCVRALRTEPSGALLEALETDPAGLHAYLAAPGARPAPLTRLTVRGLHRWTRDLVVLEDQPARQSASVGLTGATVISDVGRGLPRLHHLTLGEGLTFGLDTLDAPGLHTLELSLSEVLGLEAFLARRCLPCLLLHSLAPLEALGPGNVPARVAFVGRLPAYSAALAALTAAAKRGALRVLDLESCTVDKEMLRPLAGALQGSFKDIEVKLPRSTKRQLAALKR